MRAASSSGDGDRLSVSQPNCIEFSPKSEIGATVTPNAAAGTSVAGKITIGTETPDQARSGGQLVADGGLVGDGPLDGRPRHHARVVRLEPDEAGRRRRLAVDH